MSLVAFGIEVCKLAIMAIILFYVCELLPMPNPPKRICQLLIILVAILAVILMVLSDAPPGLAGRSYENFTTPSIIAPEKQR